MVRNRVGERLQSIKPDWKYLENNLLVEKIYEDEVRQKFLQVGAKIYPSSPTIKEIKLISNHCIFSRDDEKEGTLYIPTERNKKGIDFVLPPWLIQTTIARTHNAIQLDQVIKQFPYIRVDYVLYYTIFYTT